MGHGRHEDGHQIHLTRARILAGDTKMGSVLDQCPICGLHRTSITGGSGKVTVLCRRCGDYDIATGAFDLPKRWIEGRYPDRSPRGRYAASHHVRRMQRKDGRRPYIDVPLLRTIWSQSLPNPQRQTELLILAIGACDLSIEEYVHWPVEHWCAEVGTQDDPTRGTYGAFDLIRKRLTDKQLIEANPYPQPSTLGNRLTFEGWAEYERLCREVVESKFAFMAMSFGNAVLADIVNEHLAPAVTQTGFQLFRLDARPKAGLIDNRMRVEIRTARFLICDLSDENRGAYWEAGFAEGAGKPVFYTCEASKFDTTRTHFDTEHLFTIKWDAANPAFATDELKAAIRNEFPAEATSPDLSTD
jgi:hypothetical protein